MAHKSYEDRKSRTFVSNVLLLITPDSICHEEVFAASARTLQYNNWSVPFARKHSNYAAVFCRSARSEAFGSPLPEAAGFPHFQSAEIPGSRLPSAALLPDSPQTKTFRQIQGYSGNNLSLYFAVPLRQSGYMASASDCPLQSPPADWPDSARIFPRNSHTEAADNWHTARKTLFSGHLKSDPRPQNAADRTIPRGFH